MGLRVKTVMKHQLKFRTYFEEPLAGAAYAMLRGKFDLLEATLSSKKKTMFEFPLLLADIHAEPPRSTGEYAQSFRRIRGDRHRARQRGGTARECARSNPRRAVGNLSWVNWT